MVATDEGVVLVDAPMLPAEIRAWQAEVEQRGRIRYILNTDHLNDHVVGNFFLPGDIIAHIGTRDRMRLTNKALEQVRAQVTKVDPSFGHLMADYVPRFPNLTLFDRSTLYLGGRVLEFIHLPGHTPNNVGLYLPEDRVLFAGDTVVNGWRPYLGQCSIVDWLDTLARIEAMDLRMLVPGRGRPGRPTRMVRLLAAYLREMRDHVLALIEEGRARDEVVSRMMPYFERFPIDQSRRDEERNLYRQGIRALFDQLRPDRK
jgi:glyoxylase-like metal-dependent hydrolase (beta-lactamase superfamily II)